METNQDFSALRNLLALKKLEMPHETHVDRFLIELHRRQRAQLLVPETAWQRAAAWLRETSENFAFFPSVSCASAFAALGLACFLGLSQQVSVSSPSGGHYQLSLHMASPTSTLAMLPTGLTSTPAPAKGDLNFTPVHNSPAVTRFILANNSHAAYDATAAF